ncbi:hypothetical protein EJ04DRAFT_513193 [Polyplosphaeria fusca]|uniref:Uncharacterized protein n=1 Tax=Polyplosphaeria fusca TaxID=682080 RepID=A0A9P4UYP0_9PLEO|nr:hypothetical protein EJ04DRAFT_513193 [Polyplosphaeria fusca]
MAENGHEMRDLSNSSPSARPPIPPKSPDEQTVRDQSPNPSRHSSITVQDRPNTSLRWNIYPLLVFGFYAALSLVAWILMHRLSQRPMKGTNSYSVPSESWKYESPRVIEINEKYIKAAQVLRAIVSIFTIPVTTTICSTAAIAYMQAGGMRRSLTLGQLMGLADLDWLGPRGWWHVLSREVGSLPIVIFLALTAIGAVSQILQSAFVEMESIKFPMDSTYMSQMNIKDIPSMLNATTREDGSMIQRLRAMLDAATESDYDINLWNNAAEPWQRNLGLFSGSTYFTYNYNRDEDETTYLVEIPSSFDTGVAVGPQYAPRINSTVNYTTITEDEFRTCNNDTDNGGLYIEYIHEREENKYSEFNFTACMPGDLRETPWKMTRDRQDIEEFLYLRIGTGGYPDNNYFKARVASSLGYFELPSFHNGHKPGPLLAKDPIPSNSNQFQSYLKKNKKRDEIKPGNLTLPMVEHQGPLLALTLALFGNGSYIATHVLHPEAYMDNRTYWGDRDYDTDEPMNPDLGVCAESQPLGQYLGGMYYQRRCVLASELNDDALSPVMDWLDYVQSNSTFERALSAGIFLANKVWLAPPAQRSTLNPGLTVRYDAGLDTFKPKITNGQFIAGSVLLGLHLFGLLGLALIAAVMKPWARTWSEILLRVGANYGEVLNGSNKTTWKHDMRQLPGYIGDSRPKESVGRMEMGAVSGLGRGGSRKFEYLQ